MFRHLEIVIAGISYDLVLDVSDPTNARVVAWERNQF